MFYLQCCSQVEILYADGDRYVAVVDDKLCLVLGSLTKKGDKYVKDLAILDLPDNL